MKSFYFLCRIHLVLALSFVFLSIHTNAQTLTAHPNVSMAPNTNGYYDYLPVGYNPAGSQTYPVLIAFGGLSQYGDGTLAQLDYVFSNWGGPGWQIQNGKFPSSITVNGQLFRFIVILPQFSSGASPQGVNTLISYVISHYKADSTRIYLTGNSAGGGYVWDYPGASVQYGKRVAAIVPTCAASGYNTTKANNIAAANLPVWATHNAVDNIVCPCTTISFVNGINAAIPAPNPLAKKTIFQDAGHNCADSTFNMTYGIGAYAWMLQYKRGTTTPVNQPPVAAAGNDVTITLPTNSVQLNGNSSYDPDGNIASYSWAKTGGPTQFTISNSKIGNPIFSNLVAGTYTLSLTVTDNNGATSIDYINVIVNPAPVNQPPVAAAGNDVTITLPTNSVQLNGNSSYDPDGNIASYSWAKTGGPTQFSISNSKIGNPVFSNLVAGTYTLSLTVTDNKGATNTDFINVIVNPVLSNQPPVANAGTDITITLPTNSAQLNGNSSYDPDGNIASYSWAKTGGPTQFTISNSKIVNPVFSNLIAGTYTLTLTVTDNKGATNTDFINVIVNPIATGTKYINVNLYGGSNPYVNSAWNNWNVGTAYGSNVTSPLFTYSDGTLSGVKAVLSYSQAVGDNATNYGSGMAPAQVLEYTSDGQAPRTLTVTGLSTSLKYSFELYASRWSIGNSTIFTVNGTSVTIPTYYNLTNKAIFTNIIPNAQGQIVVNIQSLTGWNYLNGFMITQQGTIGGKSSSITQASATSSKKPEGESNEKNPSSVIIFPNPVTDKVVMQVNSSLSGIMKVQIITEGGAIKKEYVSKHASPVSKISIPVNELPAGIYIIKVQIGNWSSSKKIIKS